MNLPSHRRRRKKNRPESKKHAGLKLPWGLIIGGAAVVVLLACIPLFWRGVAAPMALRAKIAAVRTAAAAQAGPRPTPLTTKRYFDDRISVRVPANIRPTSRTRPVRSVVVHVDEYIVFADNKPKETPLIIQRVERIHKVAADSHWDEFLNDFKNGPVDALVQQLTGRNFTVVYDRQEPWREFDMREFQVNLAGNERVSAKLILLPDGIFECWIAYAADQQKQVDIILASIRDPKAEPEADPTQPAIGNQPVDVLSLIDPGKHSFTGEWIAYGGGIVSPPDVRAAVLRLPVRFPESYEITFEAQRISGTGPFAVGLSVGDRKTMLVFDGGRGKTSGLSVLRGMRLEDQPLAYVGQVLTATPASFRIIVTPGSVQSFCNGRQILDWRGKPEEVSFQSGLWSVPAESVYLGSWEGEFLIRHLKGQAK